MADAFQILSMQIREKAWAAGKLPKFLRTLQALFDDKLPDTIKTWRKAGEAGEDMMPGLVAVSLKHSKAYGIALPWRNGAEKQAMKQFVAEVLQRYEVDHYIFFSEVWLRKGNPDGSVIDEDDKQDGLIQCGADTQGNKLSATKIRRPKAGGGYDILDDPNGDKIGTMSGDMLEFLVPRPTSGFELFETEIEDDAIHDAVIALRKARTEWPS
jgi:hypothetical protein